MRNGDAVEGDGLPRSVYVVVWLVLGTTVLTFVSRLNRVWVTAMCDYGITNGIRPQRLRTKVMLVEHQGVSSGCIRAYGVFVALPIAAIKLIEDGGILTFLGC